MGGAGIRRDRVTKDICRTPLTTAARASARQMAVTMWSLIRPMPLRVIAHIVRAIRLIGMRVRTIGIMGRIRPGASPCRLDHHIATRITHKSTDRHPVPIYLRIALIVPKNSRQRANIVLVISVPRTTARTNRLVSKRGIDPLDLTGNQCNLR